MTVGKFILPKMGGGATATDFVVRFIDFDGTILKEQWVASGGSATAPTPPTHTYLTFQSWNGTFTNVTRDLDVGAIYDTTDGKTYIFVHVNSLTGLQPTIYLYKNTADEMTINWGHGDNSVTSSSGNITIQKPAAYTEGSYTITITCAGSFKIGRGAAATAIFSSGNYAFILLKIYLGAHVNVINGYGFANCGSLLYISYPSGMTGAFGDYIHQTNKSLVAVNLPSGMSGSLGAYAFQNYPALKTLTGTDGFTSVGAAAFNTCCTLDALSFASLTTINAQAFQICYLLRRLYAPLLDTIGNTSLISCYSLKTVIVSNITSLGYQIFQECHQLEVLVMPDACSSSFGNYVFYKMFRLRSLTLSSALTSITGSLVFAENYAAEEYIFRSTNPPSLSNPNVFTNIPKLCRIYVPDNSTLAYREATNWTTYAAYIYPVSNRDGDSVILFEVNGGSAVSALVGTEGTLVDEGDIPANPTKDSFVFAGWFKEAEFTNEWDWETDVFPKYNLTLYAKWEAA